MADLVAMDAQFDLVSSVEEGRKFVERGVYGVYMCGFLQQKTLVA